jgi:hypothetical protein
MAPWILYAAIGRADAIELTSKWSTAKALRYHAESHIETPKPVIWMAFTNLEESAVVTDVAIDMTCDGAPMKKQVEVKCHLDKTTIAGTALVKKEQDQLDKILREWSEHLTGADVILTVGVDGGVNLFDIEGLERNNARQGQVLEQQRKLLRRVFAPFDIALPKTGMTEPNVAWKHKGSPLQMGVLTASDMAVGGSASMTHTVDRVDGTDAYILTDGHSVMGTPETDLQKYDVVVHGQARYDLAAGLIRYTDLQLDAEYTAGSIDSQHALVNRQISWIGRIEPDGAYAALDPQKKQAAPEMSVPPGPLQMPAPPPAPEVRPAQPAPPPPAPPGGTTIP